MDFQLFANVFLTATGEQLKQGFYGVSNAGKKKGRAKRTGKKLDLNKGQTLGSGKIFHVINS